LMAAMKLPSSPDGLAHLVQEYHAHLLEVAGLAPQTCAQRVRYAKRFLQACRIGPASPIHLRKLDAPGLVRYALDLSGRCHPHTLRCRLGCVRSFLRFLTLTGRVPAGLERALSPIRAPRTFLSRYLSADELRKLLGAFDPHQTAGIRDYAMTLLAAKLGLRARERLPSCHWRTWTGRQARLRCGKPRDGAPDCCRCPPLSAPPWPSMRAAGASAARLANSSSAYIVLDR